MYVSFWSLAVVVKLSSLPPLLCYYKERLKHMTTKVRIEKSDEVLDFIKHCHMFKSFCDNLPKDAQPKDLEIKVSYKPKQQKEYGWDNPELRDRVEKRLKYSKILEDKDGNIYASEDY